MASKRPPGTVSPCDARLLAARSRIRLAKRMAGRTSRRQVESLRPCRWPEGGDAAQAATRIPIGWDSS